LLSFIKIKKTKKKMERRRESSILEDSLLNTKRINDSLNLRPRLRAQKVAEQEKEVFYIYLFYL